MLEDIISQIMGDITIEAMQRRPWLVWLFALLSLTLAVICVLGFLLG